MLFDQVMAGGNDVLCFAVIKADAVDVVGQSAFAKREHGLQFVPGRFAAVDRT